MLIILMSLVCFVGGGGTRSFMVIILMSVGVFRRIKRGGGGGTRSLMVIILMSVGVFRRIKKGGGGGTSP